MQKVKPAFDLGSNSSAFSASPNFSWQSSPVEKLLIVYASILPLLASIYLLVATIIDRRSTGSLLSFVENNRATTQIVYIVSALLAYLNVYTVTKLLNLATLIHLIRRSLSLNLIALIQAVSTKSLSTDLPAAFSTISAIIVLLFALPSILWTGALTPVVTDTTFAESQALHIPQYSTSSNLTWSSNKQLGGDCHTVINKKGIFSDCPVSNLQSSLLNQAAQATSNQTRIHSKNDNSHYSYIGRSYGVGSPAGLVDDNLYRSHNGSSLLSYSYTEPGYRAHVTCFYNTSSDFHLELIQDGKPDNGIPYVYYAIGRFPNSVQGQGVDFFAIVGQDGDNNTAVVAAKRYESRNVILVTAGSSYSDLNNTQCEVSFVPTLFTVSVEVANKLISVHPTNVTKIAGSTSPSFDPTSGLADNVMNQINGLSMISTSLYTSVVGDALLTNIRSATTNTSSTYSHAVLAAMADSFSMMVDDILLFIGSSQFFVPNAGAGEFSSVDAHLTVRAVRLGEAKYVYAICMICVMLLVVVAVEACRTRVWRSLPWWDYMNTTGLVLASAVAGGDLVDEICRDRGGREIEWTGGGIGTLREVNGKDARGGGGQNEVPKLRLRLGRKPAQQMHGDENGDEDGYEGRHGRGHRNENAKEGQVVRLAAVSLWTSDAKGIVPLA